MKTKNLSFARVYAAPECRLRAIQFEQSFVATGNGGTIPGLNPDEEYGDPWA